MTNAPGKTNLADCFGRFSDRWSPKVLADVNDMQVKAVKIQGEFVWRSHDAEDELFLVVRGSFLMRFRDRDVRVDEGEFIVVPSGVEHCPVAEEECWVVLFEPATTRNTGAVEDARTVEAPERLD